MNDPLDYLFGAPKMGIQINREWFSIFNRYRLVNDKVEPEEVDEFLLRHPGFDIDECKDRNGKGITTLAYCIASTNPRMTRKLLSLGADISEFVLETFRNVITNKYYNTQTTVEFRATFRQPPVEEYKKNRFLVTEALLSRFKLDGKEPSFLIKEFVEVAQFGDVETLKLFLEFGINPNLYGIRFRYVPHENLEILLDYGLDPFHAGYVGRPDLEEYDFTNGSIVHIAFKHDDVKILEMIKQKVPDIQQIDKYLPEYVMIDFKRDCFVARKTARFGLRWIYEYKHNLRNFVYNEAITYITFCLYMLTLGIDVNVIKEITKRLRFHEIGEEII